MNILSLLNSAPMYAICGGIIAFVAVVCAVFMVRAYRAGLAMGIDRVKLLFSVDCTDLVRFLFQFFFCALPISSELFKVFRVCHFS